MTRTMGSHQSARAETTTWLTPPEILDALGPFDLDPCAAPEPRPWSTARWQICLPADGLTDDWDDDFVWLNPPYGREAADWLAKMSVHGNGIALIFARTETKYFFDYVWNSETAKAVMFFEGRLHFHYPDGSRAKANAGAPNCLVAYGEKARQRLYNSGLKGAYVPVLSHPLAA